MAWSKRDWERHVRKLALSAECVFWSSHAKKQMRDRKITLPAALDVLKKGVIKLEPEPDLKTQDMVCRMERFVAGHAIAICVALDGENAPECIVVTAIIIGS
jgi:hypothetical protein